MKIKLRFKNKCRFIERLFIIKFFCIQRKLYKLGAGTENANLRCGMAIPIVRK